MLPAYCNGGASAVKEPDHFQVKKSSSQGRSPGVPDAANDLLVLNDLTDLHSIYCTLLPKQSNRQGGARAVDHPSLVHLRVTHVMS